ncbi:hypothetical protein [Chitinophaga sp. CF418]|uniref:hypothetical protein n=1 Tax=Chitinophaga sp. CF418 TaxID=1855287 RepID=UPI00091C8C8E|nr:hypothetical protein [Chitinophaga sp. CF418]SHN45486.1 hypothetical protein SAMN05216311_12072 [Chitinophaga sp. CF418]
MKTFILVLGIIAVLLAIATAYYTFKNKATLVYVTAVLAAVVSLITLVATQIKQNQDDQEIERVNELLTGFASGGDGNKPFMKVFLYKGEDGFFTSSFSIMNLGKYPLSNIYYEITDTYSGTCQFLKENHLHSIKRMSADQVMELNQYNNHHVELREIKGDLTNLPKNVVRSVYQGKVEASMPLVTYQVKMFWNNQVYFIDYELERKTVDDDFKVTALRIKDENFKPVSNLKTFFPLIPAELWGDFPTTLDTTSGGVKQRQAF